MKNKYFYYVVVCIDDEARFVTQINNATKYAHWNKDEAPMDFANSTAEDLAYCLNLNFYPSFVLQSYYKIENQIFVKKEKKDEE